MTTVKDLDNDSYHLITDYEEIKHTLNKSRTKYRCLFVKLDSSGADFEEIYGITSSVPYLELDAERIN